MFKHFQYITGLTATAIATVAAVFSVTGVASIFAGASIAVMIMASVLELGKLVAVSFLYRYWQRLSIFMKSYLISAIVILMFITSIGIYGFLVQSYDTVKQQEQRHQQQITQLETRKQLFQNKLTQAAALIQQNLKQQTIQQQQQQQLNMRQDTLINRKQTSLAKRFNSQLLELETKNQTLQTAIAQQQQQQQQWLDSIGHYDMKISDLKISGSNSELSVIYFLSNILNISPEQAVNLYILMFIFVFDPLAVVLVLATNISLVYDRKNNEITPDKTADSVDLNIIEKIDTETLIEPTNIESEPLAPISGILRGYVDGRRKH
jgi:hypothetical protein